MSTQPLQAASDVARGVLANVTSEQLSLPTPCSSWDVSELINHLVGAQYFFAAGVTGTPPGESPDFSSGDFVQAFDEGSAACISAFGADGVMEQMLTLPFGTMPGAAFMGLATTDTFQHAWDLAKATGQSTDLAPELATALLAQSKAAIQDSFRGPEGAPFGAEQQASGDAAVADQLAAFLGRAV